MCRDGVKCNLQGGKNKPSKKPLEEGQKIQKTRVVNISATLTRPKVVKEERVLLEQD